MIVVCSLFQSVNDDLDVRPWCSLLASLNKCCAAGQVAQLARVAWESVRTGKPNALRMCFSFGGVSSWLVALATASSRSCAAKTELDLVRKDGPPSPAQAVKWTSSRSSGSQNDLGSIAPRAGETISRKRKQAELTVPWCPLQSRQKSWRLCTCRAPSLCHGSRP